MSGARISPLPRSPRLPRLRNWLFQARGPEEGEICLVQRRVFIFPTRYGFFFAFSLLGFLAASINYDLALGFVLTFFLGSAGLVGMLHTFRNQVHLMLKPLKAEPVFAGGAAVFEVLLENRRDDERAALWLATQYDQSVIDLPPHAVEAMMLKHPAERRGWLEAPRITVETRYPLGLFRAWSYWQPALRCLIYPRPAATGPTFPDAPHGSGDGAPCGTGTEDFGGLREYRDTDNPRHIAWKTASLALATGTPLLAKHFLGAASAEIVFDLDAFAPDVELEARLSQLTRWVLDAEAMKLIYALRLGATFLKPAQGDAHQRACLMALALA